VAKILPRQRNAERWEKRCALPLLLCPTWSGRDPPDQDLLRWMARDGELLFPMGLQESSQLNLSYICFFLSCSGKGKLPATACGAFKEEEFCLVWMH